MAFERGSSTTQAVSSNDHVSKTHGKNTSEAAEYIKAQQSCLIAFEINSSTIEAEAPNYHVSKTHCKAASAAAEFIKA